MGGALIRGGALNRDYTVNMVLTQIKECMSRMGNQIMSRMGSPLIKTDRKTSNGRGQKS